MSMLIPKTPSFYAHVLNALLMLAAVILLVKHYRALRPYETIVVALLFSIGIGVHGLSHLGLETVYQFNPLNASGVMN
jgi:hypothetical protein